MDFGEGIIVNSFTLKSDTLITANITVSPDAVSGARDVSVTAPGDTLTCTRPDGFWVTEGPISGGGGCGCLSVLATTEEIASGWGLIGLLCTAGVYTHRRQKKHR